MIQKTIITLLFLFSFAASAEVFSCKDENNNVIFTDTPCEKGGTATNYHRASGGNKGFAKFSQGFINGYEGNIQIKDVVAHLSNKNQKNYISLWLYPFKLSLDEIEIAKDGAILTRSGNKPSRLDFAFADKLSGNVSYKDVEPVTLSLNNGSLVSPSSIQYFQLIKNISMVYKPNEKIISFSIKGKIDNYSILINTKTYLIYRSTGVASRNATIERNKKIVNRTKPPSKNSVKASVQGSIIFHNKVPKKLLIETPRFSVKDVVTGQWVGSFKSNYNHYTAKYSISGLPPSEYRVMVNFEYPWKTKRIAAKPGELYGSKKFTIKNKIETISTDIDMVSLIYLLEPINNNYDFATDERRTYSSPMTFKWRPLSKGITYKYLIKKVNRIDGRTHLSKHMEMDTRETKININLSPGLYHFALEAYKDDIKTGDLRIAGEKWVGFEYVFVIK